ncbi:MAG: cytochrome P450 [Alphaproteobacteria bacterium]|nr:cytochrome P450 [Alphaproteobacteria bacterium]
MDSDLYRPPAPKPLSPTLSLLRTLMRGERDLLGLLPEEAYRIRVAPMGVSRRKILLVNEPSVVRRLLTEAAGDYPKNDLMIGALRPLVGEGMFISQGETWKRQRRMLEPAFTHMRINRAFAAMEAAVADYETHLDGVAARGEVFSLEAGMSHVTADIIGRTIFSRTLESEDARGIFDDFARYQNAVANVELRRLLWGKPFADIPQPAEVTEACGRIRDHIGRLIDARIAGQADRDGSGSSGQDGDLAAEVIAAVDPETGTKFDREELVDQIGTFFLAGHETTASVLTWCFFILSNQPEAVRRMRREIEAVTGGGPVRFEHTKRLAFTRNVFRETLRLYPPLTFIPRVAIREVEIEGHRLPRGAMVMISPWIIHRHMDFWRDPDRFDPDRFDPDRFEAGEGEPGAYLPFGLGPRVCIGAAFATLESALILARLIRRFDFAMAEPDKVRPVARLTTRPASEVLATVSLAGPVRQEAGQAAPVGVV